MSPENFLKTDEAKKCKNVAFTSDEKKVIHTWMKQYAKHIIKEDEKAKQINNGKY